MGEFWRYMTLILSVLVLVPVIVEIFRWRHLNQQDRYLYLAIGAMVTSTAYAVVEAIATHVPTGLRSMFVCLSLALMLVYVITPFVSRYQSRKDTRHDRAQRH